MAQKEWRKFKEKKKGNPWEIYGKVRQILRKTAKQNIPFIYCNLLKVDLIYV